MGVIKGFNRFELNQHAVFDDQVRHVISYSDSVISHWHRVLLLHSQASLSELVSEGVFVNLLQKPRPQSVADRVCATDDLFGERV